MAPVRFTQSKSGEVESARYQSGTRTQANPEWVTGRNAVRAARRRQRTAEGALRSAEDALRGAEVAVQADRAKRGAVVRERRRRLRKALAQARAEERRCQSAVRDGPDAAVRDARLPNLPPESVPLIAQARTLDRSHDAQMPLGLSAGPAPTHGGCLTATRR
ncbi:MAG: hypothetical protein ACI9U2_002573 [Bradymonadia bacterium]|jgi:hypothetical protein